MRSELGSDIVNLFLIHLSSTDGALLTLGDGVRDYVSIRVFLLCSLHKPIPMHANQVESVEALVDSDQVNSVGETLLLLLTILTELLKANSTSALDSIVVRGEDLPHFLVQVIKNSGLILVLYPLGN